MYELIEALENAVAQLKTAAWAQEQCPSQENRVLVYRRTLKVRHITRQITDATGLVNAAGR